MSDGSTDDVAVLVGELRAVIARLAELHAAEIDALRLQHAAQVDALTATYRDEIDKLQREVRDLMSERRPRPT